MSTQQRPLIGVIMGSTSDWEIMRYACLTLSALNISYEKRVVSAHRTPDEMLEYSKTAIDRGLEVIIAGAGGAAHLPGMVATKTALPVIGVPIMASALNGLDSLLSIVQMPKEIPVATVAIGKSGAVNSAILAARILGVKYPDIQTRLIERVESIRQQVLLAADLKEYE